MKVARVRVAIASLGFVLLLGGCAGTQAQSGQWVKGVQGLQVSVSTKLLHGCKVLVARPGGGEPWRQLPPLVRLDLPCRPMTNPTDVAAVLRLLARRDKPQAPISCVAEWFGPGPVVIATDIHGAHWSVDVPGNSCQRSINRGAFAIDEFRRTGHLPRWATSSP
jgi:hypothetical protein